MVWVRSPVYFYKRKNTYYFSKAVPSDLQHRFNKRKIEVSLRTKSETKAAKSAAALSDRLQRHWDTLRMEMIYSRELGLVVKGGNHEPRRSTLTLAEGLALYQRLKGTNKTKLFFEASDRSIRYLADCLGHEQLDDLIKAWPDENGVSCDPETYAAWIRAQREHAGKFIGMALGKKRLESLTEEQAKQLYDVYQKLLEERIISEIGDDEIIAHFEIVTQQKKLH